MVIICGNITLPRLIHYSIFDGYGSPQKSSRAAYVASDAPVRTPILESTTSIRLYNIHIMYVAAYIHTQVINKKLYKELD